MIRRSELRAWLLVPKIIAVAVYFGGLAATSFIWIAGNATNAALEDPPRVWALKAVSLLMVKLVVPALLIAIVFGIALLLQNPRMYLGLRWLQVKLVLLIIVIPAGHLYCRWCVMTLRNEAASLAARESAATGLAWGLALSLLGSACVVIIARLKPRFGQHRLLDDSHRRFAHKHDEMTV